MFMHTYLQVIPYPKQNANFTIWLHHYMPELEKIYLIFRLNIENIEPFSKLDFNDRNLFIKFARYIFSKSSGVLK